jgi:hypothetical protein
VPNVGDQNTLISSAKSFLDRLNQTPSDTPIADVGIDNQLTQVGSEP